MGYGGMAYNYRGDPFLGGLVKGALKFVKGGVQSLVGGGPSPTRAAAPPVMPGGSIVGGVIGRVRTAAQVIVPGGVEPHLAGQPRRKRRRMNVTNDKALRRAVRRQQGFVKLARKALQGTGYTVVTRGSRRSKRDLGPGHTHVR